MFGVLMGTLQKFKENEDEAKKSDKVQHFSTEMSISCKCVIFCLGASESRD